MVKKYEDVLNSKFTHSGQMLSVNVMLLL